MSGASELPDAEIMKRTAVAKNGDRMQLSMELPSGRRLESEWFQESAKTKGVMAWCAAVNDGIRADAAEQRAKDKRAWEERKRRSSENALSATPLLTIADGNSGAGGQNTSVGLASSSLDPRAFLDATLKQAEEEEIQWRIKAQATQAAWEKAKQTLAQWKSICGAFNNAEAIKKAQS